MISLWLTGLVLLLLLLLGAYERTTVMYKTAVQLKGPGFLLPIIGNSYVSLAYSAKTAFKDFRKNAKLFKSGYYYYYMGRMFYQVQTAENFEFILASQNTKKGFFYGFLNSYIGTGVLTSFGPKWFERRRLITPSFHFRILNRFFHSFKSHTDTMINSLKCQLNESIDVIPMFSEYSIRLICETSMGIRLESTSNYEKTLAKLGHFIQARVFSPHIHNDTVYNWLGYARECQRLVKPMHDFSKDLIAKRRTILASQSWQQEKEKLGNSDDSDEDSSNVYFKKNQPSLLDALLMAQENSGIIDDAGIQEEVDTFIFTGHDTITAAMTYTMLCIGEYPEVQQRLYDEIKAIVKDEELTPKHLASCTYMDLVIKETLRLFPPVPIIFRTLEEDMNLKGVTLPLGVSYQLSIYDLHRDPRWFPDPETFIPERFLPENTVHRHRFAYLPFSGGLRNCIGQKYAIMQMKTMIVKMIQKYRLESVTKIKDLEFIVDMILHTTHPVNITFHRRST